MCWQFIVSWVQFKVWDLYFAFVQFLYKFYFHYINLEFAMTHFCFCSLPSQIGIDLG